MILRFLLLFEVLFYWASTGLAQDPVKVAPANYKVLLENDRVRVLEALLKPGEKTPQHSHTARVVYMLSDHSAVFRFPDGHVMHSKSKAGDTVWRDPVVHSEENDGKTDSHAILVEFKPAAAHTDVLSRSDYFIHGEAGSEVFVRHVTAGSNQQLPILLVPGGGPPSEVLFDLPVPGYSLAEDLARIGLNVFLMNPRGWGKSTATQNSGEAVGDSKHVTADMESVVNDILRSTGKPRLILFGHASGGLWAGLYATQHSDKIAALMLLNSMYGVDAPWSLRQGFEDPNHPGTFNARAGSYRLATAEGLLDGWNRSIPSANKDDWRDPLVAQAYVTLALASDPTAQSRTPPSVKIPGAFRKEHYLLSKGQKLWDAHDLKVPVLYIRGSRDHWSRPEDLEAMKHDLATTAKSRFVTIPDGTHFLFLDRPEHGRKEMLKEIREFTVKIGVGDLE
jgi:alpha-beta hydrolase superfamily lysophospholipase